MSAGQARTQIVRSIGSEAIFVRIFVVDGRHFIGRITPFPRTSLLQIFPNTSGQIGSWRMLRPHLTIHGYIAQVMCYRSVVGTSRGF